MLGLLDGISPWWWVALAILLAAAEMLTISTVLIWSAFAALITGLVLFVWPAVGGAGQIALFGGLCIALTLVGRTLVGRWGDTAQRSPLNRRAAALVGREGVVVSFAHHEGQVTVDGVPWPARLDGNGATPTPGDLVRVVAADGIVVWVRPA